MLKQKTVSYLQIYLLNDDIQRPRNYLCLSATTEVYAVPKASTIDYVQNANVLLREIGACAPTAGELRYAIDVLPLVIATHCVTC